MNYQKHYDLLIKTRWSREISKERYTEKHHIVPVCMGGSDENDNIISLLPDEHFVAHLLLAKIHNTPALWFACQMMCSGLSGRNNKLYDWARKRIVSALKIETRNRWAIQRGFSDYDDQCRFLWNLYVVESLGSQEIVQLLNVPLGNIRRSLKYHANLYGLQRELKESDFIKKSRISTQTRLNITPEQEKRRISAIKKMNYVARSAKLGCRKGKNNPMFGRTYTKPKQICPHCNRLVAGRTWHFDRCKEKPNED
jgi:hypothetical protein